MPQPNIAEYMKKLQRILGDHIFERFNPFDLIDYINEARGVVASMGECVRILCPSTSGVSGGVTITAPGTGYTSAPAVIFSPPALGVTPVGFASINVGTGHVVAVTISNPGSGYPAAQPPTISFSGGGGSGAAATCTLLPSAQCTVGQEVYNFTSFTNLIQSTTTGADSILAIRTIAVSWGGTKPVLNYMEWGDFQAYLRANNVAVQGLPVCWSQFGRGTTGSFYLWPIPSQTSQMDLDCICLPQDLDSTGVTGLEPIPYPFTNAVPYKAAQIAVLGYSDLRELSDRYEAHFQKRMEFASAAVHPALVPNYYSSHSRL